MKRQWLTLMLILAAVSFSAAAGQKEEAIRELEAGRSLLEQLQAASGLDKARLAGRVRTAFEKAVKLDPANVEARTALAGYYMNAPFIAGGSFKKAKRQAEAIVALDPADAQAHFLLGRICQGMEQWPEASAAFEKAVDLDAQLRDAWYQIGRTGALSGQNLDRALEALDVYLEKHAGEGRPELHAGAWWRRGMILEKNGRKDEAIDAYRRSLEIRPDERVTAALNAASSP